MADKIKVDDKEISIRQVDDQDYISLTDMIRGRGDASYIIRNWMRGRPTLEFLRLWERINNPN